jgi:HlyD family secretion protein
MYKPSSFPRSAWERTLGRAASRSARERDATQSVANLRSHAERGNEKVIGGLVLALMLAASGCQRAPGENVPAASSGDSPESAALEVVSPQRTVLHREVSNPGTIEAFEETPIFAKVSGYVQEGWKDRGDRLDKGETLAELWVPELEVDLRHKEALWRQAKSEIQQGSEAVSVAEAVFHSAEAKVAEAEAKREAAQARHARMKSQYDRLAAMHQVVNKENVEEAQLGFLTARANLAEAEAAVKFARAALVESKARWNKAEADLTVAKDHLAVAQQERDYAKTMLDYACLTAPYDCIVTQRHVNTGDFVPKIAGGKDKPLYVVHRTDRMRIFVQVPENESFWVQKGVEATIRVPSLSGQTFTGRVARTSWSLDPDTRTLRAEIDVPIPPRSQPRAEGVGGLRPGTYAYVTLYADVSDVLTLPRSAVVTQGDVTRGYQTFCYEMRDGKPHRLRIETGARDDRRVQVLKKQLPAQRRGESPRWVEFGGAENIVRDAAALPK